MIVTLFIPAQCERVTADTTLAWILADAKGEVLRTGTDTPAAIPRVNLVWLVIPAGRVLFTELELPPVSASRLAALLPYAVEDRLMSDPATIHAVVSPQRGAGGQIVAVVERRWLRGILDSLTALDIAAQRVLPESELAARRDGEWHVTLRERDGFLVRDDGFAVAFDHAAGSGPPLALRLAINEAKNRAPRSVRVVSSDSGFDAAAWSADLGVAIEFSAAAISGAAMARLADRKVRRIDFMSGPFARSGAWAASLALLRPAFAVAVVMLAAHLLLSFADWWRMDSERKAIEADMTATFRSAFPEARAIVDAPLQMRRNLETLKRERGLGSDNDFQTMLARAALALAGDGTSGVQARSVQWRDGRLTVDLDADKPESIDALKARAARSEWQIDAIEKRGDGVAARMQSATAK